jgi:hypothetical protein
MRNCRHYIHILNNVCEYVPRALTEPQLCTRLFVLIVTILFLLQAAESAPHSS